MEHDKFVDLNKTYEEIKKTVRNEADNVNFYIKESFSLLIILILFITSFVFFYLQLSNTTPTNTTPENTALVNTTTVSTTTVNTTTLNTTPINTTPINTSTVNTTTVNSTPVNSTPVNSTPIYIVCAIPFLILCLDIATNIEKYTITDYKIVYDYLVNNLNELNYDDFISLKNSIFNVYSRRNKSSYFSVLSMLFGFIFSAVIFVLVDKSADNTMIFIICSLIAYAYLLMYNFEKLVNYNWKDRLIYEAFENIDYNMKSNGLNELSELNTYFYKSIEDPEKDKNL